MVARPLGGMNRVYEGVQGGAVPVQGELAAADISSGARRQIVEVRDARGIVHPFKRLKRVRVTSGVEQIASLAQNRENRGSTRPLQVGRWGLRPKPRGRIRHRPHERKYQRATSQDLDRLQFSSSEKPLDF